LITFPLEVELQDSNGFPFLSEASALSFPEKIPLCVLISPSPLAGGGGVL
jgi:hypothetical protein